MSDKQHEIKEIDRTGVVNAGNQGKPVKIDVKQTPKSPPPPKPKE